jgi:hypothetical protein
MATLARVSRGRLGGSITRRWKCFWFNCFTTSSRWLLLGCCLNGTSCRRTLLHCCLLLCCSIDVKMPAIWQCNVWSETAVRIIILVIPTTFHTYYVRVSIQILANIIIFLINSIYIYNIKPLIMFIRRVSVLFDYHQWIRNIRILGRLVLYVVNILWTYYKQF